MNLAIIGVGSGSCEGVGKSITIAKIARVKFTVISSSSMSSALLIGPGNRIAN